MSLLLAGTTASGKSSLAVSLAKAHDAVIVSADAMIVYRGLDVGTAKPTPEERAATPTLASMFGISMSHLMSQTLSISWRTPSGSIRE